MEKAKFTVSDGMELMTMMTGIETLRGNHDFGYKMLFIGVPVFREHYHAQLAEGLITYLGLTSRGNEDIIVRCLRTFTNVPHVVEENPRYCYNGPANERYEYIKNIWGTACSAIISNTLMMHAQEDLLGRKRVQDALFFFHLAFNPPFLKWLRACDPSVYVEDVYVLNKDLLFGYAMHTCDRTTREFLDGKCSFTAMIDELCGLYPVQTDVYNPDIGWEHDLPDIPKDYEMGT